MLTCVQFDGCFVKSAGWFESPESLFIVMEYLPLGDLQKHMTQPFTEREAQQITLQLLEGLDFMHSNGFVHRDLKPQVCSAQALKAIKVLILQEHLCSVSGSGLVGQDRRLWHQQAGAGRLDGSANIEWNTGFHCT
jgi:hypothetical protein